jgi:NTP pyrophosphatase (non-canonical NTP hydrolase)
MVKFKVGDLVRCIDNEFLEDDLVLGAEYVVTFSNSFGVSFEAEAKDSDWIHERFELVRPAEQNGKLAYEPIKYIFVDQLCRETYASNKKAGWWDAADNALVVPTKLALVHSELSEALEAHRKGLKDDKLPQYDGIAVELADALIRIFDLAGFLGIPLGTIMAEKEAFNAKREDHKVENRTKTGGKKY